MMGDNRSLGKVADKFGVSRPTVTVWARKLNWDQRVVERDTKNMQAVREQNDADVIEQMKAYRKIIKASVADYINRLKDGKVKIDNVKDFTQLVKLDMELYGYMDSIKEQDNNDQLAVSEETSQTLFNIEQGIKEMTAGENNE
jgi:transposase